MNPYFANQFTFNNTPQTYSFINPQFQYQQPIQNPVPLPTIQSMYSTVHPYNNQEFLLKTFGNKLDFIQVFLALSHQDKLKMYMLIEQTKLYGTMSDVDGYQKILRQIAEKVQNFKNFNKKTVQARPENSQEKKKKDLESKIDLICQTTFQKLQIPSLATKQKSIPAKHQEDEDEWVESTVSAQTQDPANENLFNSQWNTSTHDFPNLQTIESNKENIIHNGYQQQTTSEPVFNMFTFDSNIQSALTKEIGLKTANQMQKLSIWELEVQQSQLKSNLREVFKKKEEQKVKQENIFDPNNQSNQFADLYNQFQAENLSNNPHAITYSTPYNPFGTQNTEDNGHTYNYTMEKHSNSNNILQFDFEPKSQTPSSNYIDISHKTINSGNININCRINQAGSNNYSQEIKIQSPQQQQQWQQAVEEKSIQPQNLIKSDQTFQYNPIITQMEVKTKSQTIQYNYPTANFEFTPNGTPFQQQFFPVQLSTPTEGVKPGQNLFDFNILQTKTQSYQIAQISQQAVNLFLSNHGQTQLLQNTAKSEYIANTFVFAPIQQGISSNKSIEIDNSMNQLFPSASNDQKYAILDNLKIQLSTKQVQRIQKRLKSKSFECDADFYLTIINHLRNISLQHTSEFQHFNEQFQIAKEIHALTVKYTAVVDEEDEEKVQQALRQSKQLYNQIYNKSNLTEKYVNNILNPKNKQKGILYKFGRLLVDSGINFELIQKCSLQQNAQIFKSFTVLFILEKMNILNKLKENADRILTYLNQQYQIYKQIDAQLLKTVELSQQKDNKYIVYIKGLVKLVRISERMIVLLKSCCIKSSVNLVKTAKICKDLKATYEHYVQFEQNRHLSTEYESILKFSLSKNLSLYDIHGKLSEQMSKNPLCSICLLQLRAEGDKIQDLWYHYSCYNLIKMQSQVEY